MRVLRPMVCNVLRNQKSESDQKDPMDGYRMNREEEEGSTDDDQKGPEMESDVLRVGTSETAMRRAEEDWNS